VEESLLREWQISQRDLPARSEGAAKSNAKKAWRFVGEMEEIAATYAAAGLPDGFHEGAAEIYRRMSSYKDGPTPSLADVLRALTPRRPACTRSSSSSSGPAQSGLSTRCTALSSTR